MSFAAAYHQSRPSNYHQRVRSSDQRSRTPFSKRFRRTAQPFVIIVTCPFHGRSFLFSPFSQGLLSSPRSRSVYPLSWTLFSRSARQSPRLTEIFLLTVDIICPATSPQLRCLLCLTRRICGAYTSQMYPLRARCNARWLRDSYHVLFEQRCLRHDGLSPMASRYEMKAVMQR